MTCTLNQTAKAADINCTTNCSKCGWNKQVNKERRGRLRNMNRQELGEFMLLWAAGGAWK